MHNNSQNKLSHKILLVFFGLMMAVVLIEAILRLSGFVYAFDQIKKNQDLNGDSYDVVILTLGESTTTSYGSDESWPDKLEKILNNNSSLNYRVFNEGKGGSNTAMIAAHLPEFLEKYNPDIVVTMVGINDGEIITQYNHSLTNGFFNHIEGFRVVKLYNWLDAAFSNQEDYKITGPYGEELAPAPLHQSDIINQLLQTGSNYNSKGEYAKSELVLREALERDSNYFVLHELLGDIYMVKYNSSLAEKEYKEALMGGGPDNILIKLSLVQSRTGKYHDAEDNIKKYLEYHPNNQLALLDLGRVLFEDKRYNESRFVFERAMALEKTPDNDYAYIVNGAYFIALNISDDKILQFYKRSGYPFTINRAIYGSKVTECNYKEIHAMLQEKNIVHVVMEYPTIPITRLQKIFVNQSGIIFVSNELNFREALKQYSYQEIFNDNFGGTFGHATSLGNRLIAENVARTILSVEENR